MLACGALPFAATAAERSETALRAAGILETYCARCHQAGQADAVPARSPLLDILDLERLARDPSLVQPGFSDASPLYTSMLRRAMPPVGGQADAAAHPSPSDEEIQAVRDWIDGLPPVAAPSCTSRLPVDSVIAAALSGHAPENAAAMRFLTLPCAATDDMAAMRDALQHLVGGLSKSKEPVRLEQVDTAGSVFRFSLVDIGWSASDWEAVANQSPDRTLPASEIFKLALTITRTGVPSLRGDWLAHMAVRGLAPQLPALSTEDAMLLAPLARVWERKLDLNTAATEIAIQPSDLAERLAQIQGSNEVRARKLLQGLVSRADFLALRPSLVTPGEPISPDQLPSTAATRPPDLTIWSDQTSYDVGSLLTLRAHTTADCHLTLIGVDRNDRATVLFPNEIEPDNLLRAGAVMSVPGATAAYQFRLNDPGPETVVGVCTVGAKIADNIHQDFERQRFTLLGDWRTFLLRSWERKTMPQRQAERRRARGRAVRRRQPAAPPKIERPNPEDHARTAIRIEVR